MTPVGNLMQEHKNALHCAIFLAIARIDRRSRHTRRIREKLGDRLKRVYDPRIPALLTRYR